MAASGVSRRGDQIEAVLATLRGVRRARLELSNDDVTEVRVLVIPEKSSCEAVDEIVSVLRDFGIAVAPTDVHVLRSGVAEPGTGARRRLASLSTERSGHIFKVTVVLELAGDTLAGSSEATSERFAELRAVARATLVAAQELLPRPMHLDSVETVRVAEAAVSVVTLTLEGVRLIGSAPVRVDEHDAVARATLDAVNRYIEVGAAEHAVRPSGRAPA